MSKKIIALFMAAVSILTLASCGGKDVSDESKAGSGSSGGSAVIAITAGANTYEIDAVEFNYYYATYYNNIYTMSSQYTQYYGYDPIGFDETLLGTTTDEDGNEVLWSKAIENYVIEAIKENYVLYNQAVITGVTLDDDEKAEIDSSVSELKDSADEAGYSLDAYLSAYYGTGMNEKVFREIAEKQALAEKYLTQLQEDITNGITSDEIKEVYDESTKDYDYADYHYYIFTAETLGVKDGETEDEFNARQDEANQETFDDAQAVFDKVTDLDSFEAALADYYGEQYDGETQYSTSVVAGTYESISSATNEDVADWIYSAGRKAVKKIVKDEKNNKAYIIYLDKAPYTSYSIDYYDCLLSDTYKAGSLLNSWDGTEDGFATIVNENSTNWTEVIEGARITDISSINIQTWLFSKDRKPGDTITIVDDDGTHILYFKTANKDDIDQYNIIRTNLASDDYDESIETFTNECTFTLNDKAIAKIVNKFVDKLQSEEESDSASVSD